MYRPFLLLYDYDFEWKTDNFWKNGSHIATGTVYTHSVYTFPVTIWLWFWMENWKFFEKMVLKQRERCTHSRSCYYMTMIWRERCTHILYTQFLLLYDYDFEWKTENFLKIWFSYSNGNGVHTCIYRSCYYMTMIWSLKLKIFENMVLI